MLIGVCIEAFIHQTAIVEETAQLENGVKVWHFCHVRNGAQLKENVSLGRDVFVDHDVTIQSGARIQNGVSIYKGVQISKNCFVGPHVIFTNDLYPRVGTSTWSTVDTILEQSCSIGAGSIIRCGVVIGSFAMIGAGSIITKSVPAFHLALGTPATIQKKVCACGQSFFPLDEPSSSLISSCCKNNLQKDILKSAEDLLNNE